MGTAQQTPQAFHPRRAGAPRLLSWRLTCVVACAVLGGCVTQSKYDDLKRRYDEAQAQLGARQNQIGDLQHKIAEEQSNAEALQRQIDDAKQQISELETTRDEKEQELASLQAQQDKLNDELAQLVKDKSKLKASTERLQQALLELNKRKVQAEQRVAEFRSLLAKFKDLIDAGKLKVKIADGRMVLVLPTDVLFDSGSAKLSKPGVEAIKEVAGVLKGMRDRRFQVEGHTDNVPIHNDQYPSNWELSCARALGVVKAMTEAGMAGQALSAAGYGEYHPVASNDNEKGRAENRRIEIVLVPDLSMLPGFEELQRAVGQQ